MNLRDLLTEAAAARPDVDTSGAPDREVIWSAGGQPFAALTGDDAAEFGLDPAIAAAASRTPDVTPSGRGPGWVRFRPTVLDDHGRDRARAWFESARRWLGLG